MNSHTLILEPRGKWALPSDPTDRAAGSRWGGQGWKLTSEQTVHTQATSPTVSAVFPPLTTWKLQQRAGTGTASFPLVSGVDFMLEWQ